MELLGTAPSWGLSWSMLVEEAPAHMQKAKTIRQVSDYNYTIGKKVMAANFQLRIWLPKFQPF